MCVYLSALAPAFAPTPAPASVSAMCIHIYRTCAALAHRKQTLSETPSTWANHFSSLFTVEKTNCTLGTLEGGYLCCPRTCLLGYMRQSHASTLHMCMCKGFSRSPGHLPFINANCRLNSPSQLYCVYICMWSLCGVQNPDSSHDGCK